MPERRAFPGRTFQQRGLLRGLALAGTAGPLAYLVDGSVAPADEGVPWESAAPLVEPAAEEPD